MSVKHQDMPAVKLSSVYFSSKAPDISFKEMSAGAPLCVSRLRIQRCHCRGCVALWHGFDPWHGNLHMPQE